jgi:predicted dehydrogenase
MRLNRREFLGTTAAGSLAAATVRAADTPLKMGLIGCGWWGMVVAKAALETKGATIVAICDVDSEHLKKSGEELAGLQVGTPKAYKHYSDLLADKNVEAVIIGTPPHWHALPFIEACSRGFDIYCEKPLAYDIREGQAMVEAARKAGNIVQVGFQRRQSKAFGQVKDYIASGEAGKIIETVAQIHYNASNNLKDPTPQDPPSSLDWDLWCGPSPKLPYSPKIRMILGENTPTSVQAAGGLYGLKSKITTPDILRVHFDFERCPVIWRHRIWGAAEYAPDAANGIFFYGEKATILANDRRWVVIPNEEGSEKQVNDARSDRNTAVSHVDAFLKAVKSRQQPNCTVEEGLKSLIAVKLAMISYETSTKVSWDRDKLEVSGNPAAAKLLKRDYRAPWEHPFKG